MQIFIVFCCLLSICSTFSFDTIDEIFEHEDCVQGSVFEITNFGSSDKTAVGDIPVISNSDTTQSKSKIHDLAAFNHIDYYYKLLNEEGPAHAKMFEVSLILGDEMYKGKGKSLKEAQRVSASIALQRTRYDHPVPKVSKQRQKLTPTVELNNLGSKLGVSVKYVLMENGIEGASLDSDISINLNSKSYMQKLNESIYKNSSLLKSTPTGYHHTGPFSVKVYVGDDTFIGSGHTIQSARHDAASRALVALNDGYNVQNYCSKEGTEKECQNARNSLKSPVSLVYESAAKRKMGVDFVELESTGPAHKRVFTFECILGDLRTQGEGGSKKVAKRAAAEEMLKEMSSLPDIPNLSNVVRNVKSKSKKKKKKKNAKLVKTVLDDIGLMVANVGSYFSNPFGGSESKKEHRNGKPKNKGGSMPKTELLNVANFLGFEVHFKDLGTKEGTSYSLVNLSLDPSHMCIGKSSDTRFSENEGALNALKFLHKKGLLDELAQKNKNLERFPFEDYIWLANELHISKDSE